MHDALKCVQTNRKKTQKRNLLLKTEIRESDVEFALIISSFTKPGMPGFARKTGFKAQCLPLLCVSGFYHCNAPSLCASQNLLHLFLFQSGR